jgi:acetoin utilization protein AcuB
MEKRCPECGKALPAGVPAWVRGLRVADAMTPNPITLGPEDSLMRALELMRLHSIRRIPIVAGGRLLGLLAEGDLKRAQPSILDATEDDFNRVMEGTQVARIMISNPITVEEDSPLFAAAQTLRQTKFGALPVVREGKLSGIVTDSDLIRCLGELLSQSG